MYTLCCPHRPLSALDVALSCGQVRVPFQYNWLYWKSSFSISLCCCKIQKSILYPTKYRKIKNPIPVSKIWNKRKCLLRWGWKASFWFPGLFVYVYLNSLNPKKPRMPHATGPTAYQLKTQTPRTRFNIANP